jgi:anti-sigma regulatory factor (Ser/Thr protein kinase)
MEARGGTKTRVMAGARSLLFGGPVTEEDGSSFRTTENGFKLRLPGGPAAASNARRALSHLRGDFDEPTMETVRLLVTELVANSVRHAKARCVSVRAVVTGSGLWLEVADEGPGFEVETSVRRGTQNDESGWGLFLVERLAHRWGVDREGDATRVWFELRR